MIDLLAFQKEFVLRHLKPGGTAVDFTMGNGHDTLFLAQSVGENGRVFAFDIQESALESTSELLERHLLLNRCTLICDSHANCDRYIDSPINAGMFNLGFLPGGDKSITTKRESTLAAIKKAIALLAPDGMLEIAVYPGHEEGTLEGDMLFEFFATLDRREHCASCFRIVNSPTSPFFFIIERK